MSPLLSNRLKKLSKGNETLHQEVDDEDVDVGLLFLLRPGLKPGICVSYCNNCGWVCFSTCDKQCLVRRFSHMYIHALDTEERTTEYAHGYFFLHFHFINIHQFFVLLFIYFQLIVE